MKSFRTTSISGFPLSCGVVLFWTCVLLSSPTYAQSDPTRQDGGKGADVVELVLRTLQNACIYPDYNLFLRRLAYVETRDGNDPATYTTPGYNGGIWKVDEAMLKITQTEANVLSAQLGSIRDGLLIDWSQVTWSDLRKPLYSALAAALYLTLQGAPQNIPSPISAQGTYWLQHYRVGDASLTVQNYSAVVETFDHSCARTGNLDVLFIVDTSSSVGSTEWDATRHFLTDIIMNLALHNGIAPNKDRVALVTFSSDARLAFGFDIGSDLHAVIAQIQNAPHTPGGTNLAAALHLALTEAFNGSRPDAGKVIVLVTDGVDTGDSSATSIFTMRLKAMGVQIYAVGISSVPDSELSLVATAPSCAHTRHVHSYDQLGNVKLSIESFTCRVPEVLSPGLHTYPCGTNVLAQISGSAFGSSITVSAASGDVHVFATNTSAVPTREAHDINTTASALAPVSFASSSPRPLTLSLQSEQQNRPTCSGNFTIRVEDNAAKRTDCNGREPDFVFLLDSTLAHTDDQWRAMLQFVQDVLRRYDVMSSPPQVALLSFAENTTTHISLSPLTENIMTDLENITRPPASTASDLAGALTFVAHHVLGPASGAARPGASKTVILVTPGRPANTSTVIAQASRLHLLGTRIAVAAVGDSFDDVHLNTIASSRQHVEKVAAVTSLSAAAGRVLEEACQTVTMLCVEAGVSRECLMEDVMGGHCGEMLNVYREVTSNPCAIQIAASLPPGMRLDRFPHLTDVDKFLLCDNIGQAYVVLCPLGQVYSAQQRECSSAAAPVNVTTTETTTTPATITTPTTTTPTTTSTPSTSPGPNPCTAYVIATGQFYQPHPSDPTKFYHCTAENVGTVESCPLGKIWVQQLVQCIWRWVIADETTNRMDPSINNPCLGASDFISVPSDVTAYIECNLMHEGFLRYCPSGQVWNAMLAACDKAIIG